MNKQLTTKHIISLPFRIERSKFKPTLGVLYCVQFCKTFSFKERPDVAGGTFDGGEGNAAPAEFAASSISFLFK